MRIIESARRHGVADDDMLHALRLASRRIPMDEGFVLYIGPARTGSHLEVGVTEGDPDDPVIVHAMTLRPAFHRYL